MNFFSKQVATVVFFTTLQMMSFAQYLPKQYEQKNVGSFEPTHKAITAQQFAFDKTISSIYVDTQANNVTLQLKTKAEKDKPLYTIGSILLFDLKEKRLRWSNKITYKEHYSVQGEGYLVHNIANSEGRDVYLVNMATGKDDLQLKNSVFKLNASAKMGLGFTPHEPNVPDRLVGVSLENGNISWERKFPGEDPVVSEAYLNDSVMSILSSGLHIVHLKSGLGWDYNTITSEENYLNTTPQDTGEVEKLLPRNEMTSSWDPRGRLYDISSVPVKDSNYFYFASKERIAKISRTNGNVMWSYEFKDEGASMSWLFLHDSAVFMVNYGRALRNREFKNYGKPFIAAFNKETGRKIFLNKLENNQESIKRAKHSDSLMCLIYKRKLAIYSLADGRLVKEEAIPERLMDHSAFFSGNKLFVNRGNFSTPDFGSIDSGYVSVITKEHQLLQFKNDLTFLNASSDSVLYKLQSEKNGFKIINSIRNDRQMFMLDASNKVLARFEAPSNSKLIGNRLYGFEENKLIETDLSEILK